MPWTVWLTLGLIVLGVAGLRLRLLDAPLERDEGEYAYVGQLILRGEVPYAQAYTAKFPGVHYAYALILTIFGQTDVAIHRGLLVVNAVSIVLLFLLASRLFDPVAGLAAAGAFALLSLSKTMYGFSANVEHFVVLPMLGGLLLLVRSAGERRRGRVLGAGVLLGFAVLMKQHAAAFVLCGGILLVAQGGRAWRQTLLNCLLFAGGAALPLGVASLYLWAKDAFEPFWFWTITYARHYASMQSFGEGMTELSEQSARIAGSAVSLWALAAVGATAIVWDKQARASGLFLFLFTGLSFLAVCPALLFRPHYFLLFVPAASLLVGVGAAALGRRFSPSLPASQEAAILAAAAILIAVFQQQDYFFVESPQAVARTAYGVNPFAEAREIALYVGANSAPDDRIAVLGSEPEIYFYAQRQAATGFLYTYPLMEPQPYAVAMQKDMIAQIERENPRFLVAVNLPTSWLPRPNSSRLIYSWINDYVKAHYRCVGVADMQEEDYTEYRWGEEATSYKPLSQFCLYLYERTAPR